MNRTLLVYLYFLKLIRLPNLLILALSQLAVFVILIHQLNPEAFLKSEIYLLILISSMTGAAGYIINDYYDIKIDWVNKPQRVVISRYIQRRFALILHFLFNFLALVLSIFLGWKVLLSVFLTEALLWWYSNQLKRTPFWGNLVVALLSAYALMLPAVMESAYSASIWFFAAFAFLISLIRELIKDVEDLDGDARYGCITLAVRFGMSGVKKITYALLVLLLISVGLFAWYFYSHLLVYYCALVLLPLFFVLLYKTYQAKSTSDFAFLSTLCKAIMLAGLTAMCWGTY